MFLFLLALAPRLGLSECADPTEKQNGELSVKFEAGTFDCDEAKTPEFRQKMMDFIGLGAADAGVGEELFIRECGTYQEITDGAFLDDGGYGRKGDKNLFEMWDLLNDAGSISEITYEAPLGIDPPKDEDGIYVNFDIKFGEAKGKLPSYEAWGTKTQGTDTFKEDLEEALGGDPINVIAYHAAQRTDENCGQPECVPKPSPPVDYSCGHCDEGEARDKCHTKLPETCVPKGSGGEDCPSAQPGQAELSGGGGSAATTLAPLVDGGSSSGGSGGQGGGGDGGSGFNPGDQPFLDISKCETFTCDHCNPINLKECEEGANKCEQMKAAALAKIEELKASGASQEEIEKIAVIHCDKEGNLPLTYCGSAAGIIASASGVENTHSGGCACVDPETGELIPDTWAPEGEEPNCSGEKPFPLAPVLGTILGLLALCCLAFWLWWCCCRKKHAPGTKPVNPIKPKPVPYSPIQKPQCHTYANGLQPNGLPPCPEDCSTMDPAKNPNALAHQLSQQRVPLQPHCGATQGLPPCGPNGSQHQQGGGGVQMTGLAPCPPDNGNCGTMMMPGQGMMQQGMMLPQGGHMNMQRNIVGI